MNHRARRYVGRLRCVAKRCFFLESRQCAHALCGHCSRSSLTVRDIVPICVLIDLYCNLFYTPLTSFVCGGSKPICV